MMLTRCPACQTVFRLRPEQLHARRGEVRCGHCFHPFNAIEHGLDMPADEAPTAPPPSAPDFFILEDKPVPRPARPSPTSMLDFGIPEIGFEPKPELESHFGGAPTSAAWQVGTELEQPAITPIASTDKTDRASTPTAEPAPQPLSTPAVTPETDLTALPRVFPGVLRSGRRPAAITEPPPADDAPTWPGTTAEPALQPAAPEPARRAHAPVQHAPPETEDAAAHEPDIARLNATYGRPPREAHPVLQAFGWMLVVALTLLLGAQSAYLYRMEIARELPGLRPLLTEACAHAKCVIPYPQDAERIAIEASDLQAEPGKSGHYLLHATLNNRAEYPQRWPHLELTLTDAGDNPISRRVLAPTDWLSAGEDGEAFPARHAIELRLPFAAPGVAPTGYRIYAFYP